MTTFGSVFQLSAFIVIGLVVGCGDALLPANPDGGDTDSQSDTDTWSEYPAQGVDILFIVDNWHGPRSQAVDSAYDNALSVLDEASKSAISALPETASSSLAR